MCLLVFKTCVGRGASRVSSILTRPRQNITDSQKGRAVQQVLCLLILFYRNAQGDRMDKNQLFREIPKVDILLKREELRALEKEFGRAVVLDSVREALGSLRRTISEAEQDAAEKAAAELIPDIIAQVRNQKTPGIRRVINATGTILHTGLGRAPLCREHAERLSELVCGYSNLEYDLETGKRGERYAHLSPLLTRLTGAEDALIVNNNAAALLLMLNTVAKGGEVIISRGELVEIGGNFRIPDILAAGNAVLKEVGTTNKTHLRDYEEAINEKTSAILKVHTSNYRIVGFTESVSVPELRKLGDRHGIPVIQDLGSGVLVDLSRYGAGHEPTVREAVADGADLVSFSGDKLLGGPQAGIILGKRQYIGQLKKNPLTRALRVDKFTVGALEMVLQEYVSEETMTEKIPVLRMISESEDSCRNRAEELCAKLREAVGELEFSVQGCTSQAGGGALPVTNLPGFAVTVKSRTMTVNELEKKMRSLRVPIISRIMEDLIWLDIRTIGPDEYGLICEGLAEACSAPGTGPLETKSR